MSERRSVHTTGAPEAIGPYSQAVIDGDWLYCSGQVGIDPASGELVGGGFEAEARRVFANLAAVLGEAGMTFADVVKTTVYVTDLSEFPRFNAVYAEHFVVPHPARATVEVSALPKGASVEIDLVARRTSD